MGTISYMSPEQALGKPLDQRSDVFSLGVVLYEMLTGNRAFRGDTSAAVFDAILNRAPVAPMELNPGIPAELARIVNRALEKDPALRYQSTADLASDLRRTRRDSSTATRPSSRRWALGAIVGLVVIASAIWQTTNHETKEDPAAPDVVSPVSGLTIAVLPLANASGDPDQRYFSDGLTDDIVNELSRYGELAVIPCKTDACSAEGVDARAIGETLGVRYVLQGSVQTAGERIRVNVRLSDGADGRRVWGNDYTAARTARDLFDLQDELTQQVVQEVAGSYGVIVRTELSRTRREAPQSLASHECIFRVYQYVQLHGAEHHLEARECLESVVEAEPDYVDGLAWLAYLYNEEFHHRYNEPSPGEYDSRQRALEFAERAVRLDHGSHLAHAYLGLASLFHGERERGIAEMRLAHRLQPNHTSTLGLLANYLAYSGEFEDAVAICNRAIALSPNPPQYVNVPFLMDAYFHGRYEEALVYARGGVISVADDFRGPLLLAATLGQLGRLDEAAAALEEMHRLWKRPASEIRDELMERHAFAPHVADSLIEGLAKAGLEGL